MIRSGDAWRGAIGVPPWLAVAVAVSLSLQGVALAQMRPWTAGDGRQVRAEATAVAGGVLEVVLADGRAAEFPVDQLSERDQRYLAWRTPDGGGPLLRMSSVRWPSAVRVDPGAIEVEEVPNGGGDTGGSRVFRSGNFEFVSDAELAGSVMKEVSRAFEATYALALALPWQIHPRRGEDRFRSELYRTFLGYVRAGGPPNSGGVYKIREHKFMVPFASLGVREKNGRFYKDEEFDVETLVHEVTHMVMHEQLPFLPIWVIEGSADYTGTLPYSAGRFRCDDTAEGLRSYLAKYVPDGLALDDLRGVWEIPTGEWQRRSMVPSEQLRLYRAALVLFYYFLHLDGRGDGEGMLRLMHSAAHQADAWRSYEAAYRRYEAEFGEFVRKPGVKVLGDGTVVHPDGEPPPREPVPPVAEGYSEALRYRDIKFLARGRSEGEVLADLQQKFADRLRIRIR